MTVRVPDPAGMPEVLADLDAARATLRERHELFGTDRAAPVQRLVRLVELLGTAAPSVVAVGGRSVPAAAATARNLDLRLALLDLCAETTLMIEALDRCELALHHKQQAHERERAALRARGEYGR